MIFRLAILKNSLHAGGRHNVVFVFFKDFAHQLVKAVYVFCVIWALDLKGLSIEFINLCNFEVLLEERFALALEFAGAVILFLGFGLSNSFFH